MAASVRPAVVVVVAPAAVVALEAAVAAAVEVTHATHPLALVVAVAAVAVVMGEAAVKRLPAPARALGNNSRARQETRGHGLKRDATVGPRCRVRHLLNVEPAR